MHAMFFHRSGKDESRGAVVGQARRVCLLTSTRSRTTTSESAKSSLTLPMAVARGSACFARLLCLDDERLLAHARTEQVVTRAREMMRTMDPCAEANL